MAEAAGDRDPGRAGAAHPGAIPDLTPTRDRAPGRAGRRARCRAGRRARGRVGPGHGAGQRAPRRGRTRTRRGRAGRGAGAAGAAAPGRDRGSRPSWSLLFVVIAALLGQHQQRGRRVRPRRPGRDGRCSACSSRPAYCCWPGRPWSPTSTACGCATSSPPRTCPGRWSGRSSFPDGSPWAMLELADDDQIAVLAVQAADGGARSHAVRALRALHARHAAGEGRGPSTRSHGVT